MNRALRLLPAIAVVSAVLTTLVLAGAHHASLDYFFKDSSRMLAHMGSFQGMPVATLEEVRDAEAIARALRKLWHVLAGVFVVSMAAALWVARDRIWEWPWLSALALAVGLGVLYLGIVLSVGRWALPMALGIAAGVFASFELLRARRLGRRQSIVTWTALYVAVCALIVNIVRVR